MSRVRREGIDLALRELRASRGLSAEEAAQRAGLGKTSILGWESGRRTPSGPHLVRLLDVLDADPRLRARLLYAADPQHARIELSDAPLGVPVGFGEVLRAMRRRKRTTQIDLARSLGVSQGTIAKWETGIMRPDAAMIHALGYALGASAEETVALAAVSGENDLWNEATTPEDAVRAYGKIKWGGPLTEPIAMAYEAETWRRATRDSRWDAALCRAISARAFYDYYSGASGLGVTHAHRALRLARTPEAKSASLVALDIASEVAKRRHDDPGEIARIAGDWARALPEGNERSWALWIQSLRLATLGRREAYRETLQRSIEAMRPPFDTVISRSIARARVYIAAGDGPAAAESLKLEPDEFWHIKLHTEVRHSLGEPVSEEWMVTMREYRGEHPAEFTWHDHEQWRALERRQTRLLSKTL